MKQRILILRPDHLGDLVLFSGALRHIRARFPRAHISLSVARDLLNYVELCPWIDCLIPWEDLCTQILGKPNTERLLQHPGVWRFQSLSRRVKSFLSRRRYRARHLLLPLRSPSPYMQDVVGWLPATRKIGIVGDLSNQTKADASVWRNVLSRFLDVTEEPPWRSEFEITRQYLELLGIDAPLTDLWPELWTSSADKDWAMERLPVTESGHNILLGIAPGVTSVPGKDLPPEWFASGMRMVSKYRFRVVLFGCSGEKDVCARVAAGVRSCPNVSAVVDLSGQTTIRQVIECLRRCDVIVSQETATLHFGVTLRKPVIGILGGGHYGRFYPWGDPAISRVLDHPMSCYHCNWECRHPTFGCIQGIDPARLAAELAASCEWSRQEKCSPLAPGVVSIPTVER